MPNVFICYNSSDQGFVLPLAGLLKRCVGSVFWFQDHQDPKTPFPQTLGEEIEKADLFLTIVGEHVSPWQQTEYSCAIAKAHAKDVLAPIGFMTVVLRRPAGPCVIPQNLGFLGQRPKIEVPSMDMSGVRAAAAWICRGLRVPWRDFDGLPLGPSLFSYEKKIIEYYSRLLQAGFGAGLPSDLAGPLLDGCPPSWPEVLRRSGTKGKANLLDDVDPAKMEGNQIVVSAGIDTSELHAPFTLVEARPRSTLHLPPPHQPQLSVAVLVSGGVAPGVNAVIHGIVQRHWSYARAHGYDKQLVVFGLQNGFRAFDHFHESHKYLAAEEGDYGNKFAGQVLHTNDFVAQGGSILQTARVNKLLDHDHEDRALEIERIVRQLRDNDVDILYVIGGDGSMKAARALSVVADDQTGPGKRPLSVIGIPKTMDNDILWVWQSFGFMSAVERGRELIGHLSTEVSSNPRLCVVQLFGSDSGFVVSHVVLASATGPATLALVPEVDFSIAGVARCLKRMMRAGARHVPQGMIVMAETAIPTDALDYLDVAAIGLSDAEKDAVRTFVADARKVKGQTNDALRTAGLKLVARGTEALLQDPEFFPPPTGAGDTVRWNELRVFTSEPRHLLRAVPPSASDIIIGQRLGTLAVDNALAGYTAFMISQWLTEYVLVPLSLVVLGRKRLWTPGMFWRSVIAKTGQKGESLDWRPEPSAAT